VSSVTYDRQAPTLSAVTISTNNTNTAYAKEGSIITLAFTAANTENLLADPTVTILTKAADVSGSGASWTATYIAVTGDADANFTSTSVNYTGSNGSSLGTGDSLQAFLGADAASLTADPVDTDNAIITLQGDMHFEAGSYVFKVSSDDGFELVVDGAVVGAYDGNRGTSPSVSSAVVLSEGMHNIDLIYWDNTGGYSLKVEYAKDGGAYQVLDASLLQTAENSTMSIDVLANDTDVDSTVFSLDSVKVVDAVGAEVTNQGSVSVMTCVPQGSVSVVTFLPQGGVSVMTFVPQVSAW